MKSPFYILCTVQVAVFVVWVIAPHSQGLPTLCLIGILVALKGIQVANPFLARVSKYEKEMDSAVEEAVQKRVESMTRLLQKYEQDAITDPLTGILNRRGGEEAITKNIYRSRRIGTAISFVLVDLDHFKQVNDTYGHATGDIVLCSVTRMIATTLRTADFAVRWGGEELLVCLPDTDLEGAAMAAEKLRQGIEGLEFEGGLRVTASFGCSEMGTEELHVTLARADMNLYVAKSRGRNCVFPQYP